MKDQKTMPIFIKVEEYRDILDVLDIIKEKIKAIRETLASINSLRNEEDEELNRWNNAVSEIERKIEDIDKLMFEPEHT